MSKLDDQIYEGIWFGEWMDPGNLVVFDPAIQQEGSSSLFYNVALGKPFKVMSNRVGRVIKRIEPPQDRDAVLASYLQWRRTYRPAEQSTNPRSKSTRRGRRNAADYGPLGPVQISDAQFEEDWRVFGELFPNHFDDPQFLDQERTYKREANQRILDLLSREALSSLSEEDLIARILRATSETDNLLFSTEHAAFHGALNEGPHRERLVAALRDLLWGAGPDSERFTAWTDAVEALPATGRTSAFKWPVVTALPYLAQPERHCILKPRNAQATAKRYRIGLHYSSQSNSETYRRWLEIVEAIGARLQDRGARDRLDLQSFLWRVDR